MSQTQILGEGTYHESQRKHSFQLNRLKCPKVLFPHHAGIYEYRYWTDPQEAWLDMAAVRRRLPFLHYLADSAKQRVALRHRHYYFYMSCK